MNLLPEKLKQEAIDYLLGDILVCNIPKLEVFDGSGGVFYTDIEGWEDYGKINQDGDFTLPSYFIQKLTVDGDEYVPVGDNVIFGKELIFSTALDIAKEDYPDMYNEIVNVNTIV